MQVNYGMLAANNEIPVSLSYLNTGKAKAGSALLCYQQQRLLPTVLFWPENVASTRMTQSPIGSPYKIRQIELGRRVTRGHREGVCWHVHRLIDCFLNICIYIGLHLAIVQRKFGSFSAKLCVCTSTLYGIWNSLPEKYFKMKELCPGMVVGADLLKVGAAWRNSWGGGVVWGPGPAEFLL